MVWWGTHIRPIQTRVTAGIEKTWNDPLSGFRRESHAVVFSLRREERLPFANGVRKLDLARGCQQAHWRGKEGFVSTLSGKSR